MTARLERSSDDAEIALVLHLTPREFLALRQGTEAATRSLRAAIKIAETQEESA